MSKQHILIVGAGLAGLTMAAQLSHDDYQVTLIAPNNKKTPQSKDMRSTAIMNDGVDYLKNLGVWNTSNDDMAPLETMRIVYGQKTIDFHAEEVGRQAFAFNILNQKLRKNLIKKIRNAQNIQIISDRVISYNATNSDISVITESGKTHTGHLVIAADGQNSIIRKISDIQTTRRNFDQSAFVCVLSHKEEHHNISTEFHRHGGPFTLVPMPGKNIALVWCDKTKIIEDMAKKPQETQESMIQKIIGLEYLSDIKIISQPQIWPICSLKAKNLTAHRVVFIGETAHSLPPIAAQGFNLTLRDIICLSQSLKTAFTHGLDVGSQTILKKYEKERKKDIALRYYSVSMLNSLITDSSFGAHILKNIGLSGLSLFSPLRQITMRFGMKA